MFAFRGRCGGDGAVVLLPDAHLDCTAILLGGNGGGKQTQGQVPQSVIEKQKLWNLMLPVSIVWGLDLRGVGFLQVSCSFTAVKCCHPFAGII